MKLVYATTFDSNDVRNWSGTPFFMAKGFVENGIDIERIGNLKRKLPLSFKWIQAWKKWVSNQRESPRFNVTAAIHYSHQVDRFISNVQADAVVSPLINPIAFLETNKPIVLWTDAMYASLVGFYPVFCNHSASSIEQGNRLSTECLNRCRLAIFSSDWAARGAIELYGASKEKVKVVPYGANIESTYTEEDIRSMIKNRPRDRIKLLFVGKQWYRKGADIVFNVTKALHASGQKVELHFVGCHPPKGVDIPAYIHCHGFISKKTTEGMEKMTKLFSESHFLFLPSRAEACAIAFCEASAFGLPTLTSHVGGISTVIRDGINGMTFGLDAHTDVYCSYITNLMQNYEDYKSLALSSFNEFQTRLNWKSATLTVKKLIQEHN